MSFLIHLFFVVTVAVFSRQQTQKVSFFQVYLLLFFVMHMKFAININTQWHLSCVSPFSHMSGHILEIQGSIRYWPERVYFYEKRALSLKKKGPQKFSHPYSIQSLFDSRLQYRPSICPVCSIFKNKKNKKSVTTQVFVFQNYISNKKK